MYTEGPRSAELPKKEYRAQRIRIMFFLNGDHCRNRKLMCSYAQSQSSPAVDRWDPLMKPETELDPFDITSWLPWVGREGV